MNLERISANGLLFVMQQQSVNSSKLDLTSIIDQQDENIVDQQDQNV